MSLKRILSLALAAAVLPCAAWAVPVSVPVPPPPTINGADTSWILISSALVLLMTPGLAFFYAGLVRGKNVVSTLYQNFISLSAIGLLWATIGYSIAFAHGGKFFGDMSYFMLDNVGQDPINDTATIPHNLFMMYQMMFAIIAPALITGAFAERVRFKAWLLILILWSLAVYSPVAHWVWGGGWLSEIGALDFAGGLVVHVTAGFSALVAAVLFGKRRDFTVTNHQPYDIGMVFLGTALLWFGWFGFNAGSALSSGALASQAFMTTFLAGATSLLAWTLVDTMHDGKPTLVGGCVGAVAGLATLTPAAGFVTAGSAVLIGLTSGVVCNLAARILKKKFKIDDALDVFACHGLGGIIGVVMTGLLATTTVNHAGANGLMYGESRLFIANLIAAGAVALYSVVITYVIIKVVGAVTPIRVTVNEEKRGLDTSQHGEIINEDRRRKSDAHYSGPERRQTLPHKPGSK